MCMPWFLSKRVKYSADGFLSNFNCFKPFKNTKTPMILGQETAPHMNWDFAGGDLEMTQKKLSCSWASGLTQGKPLPHSEPKHDPNLTPHLAMTPGTELQLYLGLFTNGQTQKVPWAASTCFGTELRLVMALKGGHQPLQQALPGDRDPGAALAPAWWAQLAQTQGKHSAESHTTHGH